MTEQEACKKYVHQRLDAIGVPYSIPESEHDKAGCRVGGRLDWVESRIKELEADLAAIKQQEPVGYVREYALEHLKNTRSHTVIDAEPRAENDTALFSGGYEDGKKDGWEACETCHGIVDGKLPQPAMLSEQAPCDIPEGWKLVPVEPTEKMLEAAFLRIESEGIHTTPWLRGSIYRTMLSAAPKPEDGEKK